MKSNRFVSLGLGLLLLWLLVITFLRANLQTPVRLFSDEYDRFIYFERGAWFTEHLVPYRDVLSEYPQVPTYFFGLVRAVTLGEGNIDIAYWKFSSAFSLLMLVILAATIELLYRMLPTKKYRAYLLLLPAPLFFSFNRFDILPACLSLLSYKMLREEKWDASALLLGVGALTKWYPALFMPAYLAYYYQTHKRIQWRVIVIFGVTCSILLLPTLISGGIDALLVPYRFHMERGLETVSLPTLVGRGVEALFNIHANQQFYSWTFFLLQVCPSLLVIWARPNTGKKLLNWCILITCTFVLFSRIYSPQWLLWILPFYILASDKKADVALIVFYGVATYVGFPVVWDYFGEQSVPMIIMGLVNIFCLVLIGLAAFLQIAETGTASVSRGIGS